MSLSDNVTYTQQAESASISYLSFILALRNDWVSVFLVWSMPLLLPKECKKHLGFMLSLLLLLLVLLLLLLLLLLSKEYY